MSRHDPDQSATLTPESENILLQIVGRTDVEITLHRTLMLRQQEQHLDGIKAGWGIKMWRTDELLKSLIWEIREKDAVIGFERLGGKLKIYVWCCLFCRIAFTVIEFTRFLFRQKKIKVPEEAILYN